MSVSVPSVRLALAEGGARGLGAECVLELGVDVDLSKQGGASNVVVDVRALTLGYGEAAQHMQPMCRVQALLLQLAQASTAHLSACQRA